MIRLVIAIAASTAIVAGSMAQPPTEPPRPKYLSEFPLPKIGTTLTLVRAEPNTIKDDDGLLEVIEMLPAKEQTVVIHSTTWDIDADGWFDAEGFNITKAYPRSGLWAMRTAKGNRRPGGSGLPTAPAALVPNTPPRLFRAGAGDIITHIDGIAVTNFQRFVYAINGAKNPRDLPIIVKSGNTGRDHLYYITAYKTALE